MRLTFLGTGDAGGVPLFGCHCPACDKARTDITLQRDACCVLVENDNEQLLIDAGLGDLHTRFTPERLKQILLTHYHMDHVQGLFKLRWGANVTIPVLGPDDSRGCDDLFKHPGILDFSRKLSAFEPFDTIGLEITPLPLQHSRPCMGYQLSYQDQQVLYLTDTIGLPQETLRYLQTITIHTLIIDCTHPPHTDSQSRVPRNHNDLDIVLGLQQLLKPNVTYLTHISHEMDNWLLEYGESLPFDMRIARDGLVLDFD